MVSRCDSTLRRAKVDCFFIDRVQPRQAGALKLVKARQHERGDCQEREHNQTCSDAQEQPVSMRAI